MLLMHGTVKEFGTPPPPPVDSLARSLMSCQAASPSAVKQPLLSLTCQKEEKVESDDDRESAKAAKRKKEAERRTATAAVRRRGERIANSGQSRLYQMRS